VKNKFLIVSLIVMVLLTLTTTSILAAGMSKEQLLEVQKVLKEGKHYTGQLDGVYGPLTRKAIKSYQETNDLKTDTRNIEENYLAIMKSNKKETKNTENKDQNGYFEVKLGVEPLGNAEVSLGSLSSEEDVKTGVSLTSEYKYPLKNTQWTIGGGVSYQFKRGFDNKDNDDKFNLTNFYGLTQYNIKDTPVHLVGKLGYGLLNVEEDPENTEVNGGLYYALGTGMTFGEKDQYVVEALYSANNGEFEGTVEGLETTDFKYSTFQISAGMRF
jgi:peptidoglycan hydrolase-like protein with peptidoglycan-binding domain